MIRIIPLCLLLCGCTFVSYSSADGARARVIDFRMGANAIELDVSRQADGSTTLTASRAQESPENTVEAIGDAVGSAVNPARGLLP